MSVEGNDRLVPGYGIYPNDPCAIGRENISVRVNSKAVNANVEKIASLGDDRLGSRYSIYTDNPRLGHLASNCNLLYGDEDFPI